MMILALDFLAAVVLTGFVLFGLLIPLSSLWSEFLPHAVQLLDPEVLAAAKITVIQAGLSASISLIAGILLAMFLPRKTGAVRALLALPFGVPAVAAAAAWTVLLPKALSFSLSAVIIAQVFFNIPWAALWTMRALDEVSPSEMEAAATLGATRLRIFAKIILPRLMPSLASIFAQVFSWCAMSFILVMILGGGPPVETLETTLFEKIRAGGLDLSGASVCAIWQIAITMLPWLIVRQLGVTRLESGRASRSPRNPGPVAKWSGVALASLFILPYLALFYHSNPTRILEAELRGDVVDSFITSACLAVATAILSVPVALLGVWAETRNLFFARMGSLCLVLPSGISVMVLGLGFFVAFGHFLDPFSASIWPIAMLQAIFFVPVAFRVFQPIGRSRDVAAWEAAATLGATPTRIFSFIEWPRWRDPILSVTAMIAGASLGEVAAVSLFYNEHRIPVSLSISRWMGQYRFEDAQALSLLLVLASVALICVGFIRGTGRTWAAEYARVD